MMIRTIYVEFTPESKNLDVVLWKNGFAFVEGAPMEKSLERVDLDHCNPTEEQRKELLSLIAKGAR
jgi:hypothetical protein